VIRLSLSRGAIATATLVLVVLVTGCEAISVTTVEVGQIDVTPRSLELSVGETLGLTATVEDPRGQPLPGRTVVWTTSDPTVASVDSSGRVLGLALGNAAITATSGSAVGSAVVTVGLPAEVVLSADSIAFTTTEGGSAPPPQVIQITNGGGVSLTGIEAFVSYHGSIEGWLASSLSGSTAPATLTLTPLADGLEIGTYTADVEILSARAATSPRTIRVFLRIHSSGPTIGVEPDTIRMVGRPAVTDTLRVFNVGGGTLDGLTVGVQYSGSGARGWLSTTLTSARAPTVLVLTASSASLSAGTYRATVVIGSTNSLVTALDVPVEYLVADAPPSIDLGTSHVSLSAGQGRSTPITTTVAVNNGGSGTLDGLAKAVSYAAGQPRDWLTAAFASTTAPTTMVLSAEVHGLAQGAYDASVEITGNASNSPQLLTVRLTVGPPGSSAPSPPTGLSASVVSATDVDLSWTDVSTNETAFEIESSAGGSAWTRIATEPAGTEAFRVTGLTPDTSYEFRVRACAGSLCSSWAGPVAVTTPKLGKPPKQPTSFQTASVTSSRVDLEWKDASKDESEFRLERASGLFGPWQSLATLAEDTESYSDTTVTSRSFYRYRIAACNLAGCSSFAGPISVFVP
jgi:hypothetical protein